MKTTRTSERRGTGTGHPRRSKATPGPGSESVPSPITRLQRLLLAVGVAAAAVVLFLFHAHTFWRYVNDDAYITFRYSRFVALGRGPYFNLGEHVEGYTSLLFMVLMIPVVSVAPTVVPTVAKMLGVISGCGALLTAAALGAMAATTASRRHLAAAVVVLAPALIAVSPSFAVNSTNGLETTTYGCLLALGIAATLWACDSRRWRGAGILLAASSLARPDAVAVIAAFWIALALTDRSDATRRQLALDLCLVGFAVIGQVTFRWLAYDHELLPNTYFAKAGGFWGVGAWQYVQDGALAPFGGAVAAVVGVIAAVALSPSRVVVPVAVAGVFGAALPIFVGIDWMPGQRLVMPYLPLVAVTVALGWLSLAAVVVRNSRRLGVLVVLIAGILWQRQADARAYVATFVNTRANGYEHGHRQLARWLGEHAAAGDAVALMDIGIIGYECIDQRILDITGLTDRFVAKSPGMFLDKQYDPAYVLDQRPRYIVLVLTAPGDPSVPVQKLDVTAWTRLERGIATASAFQQSYVHPTAIDVGSDQFWLDRMAGQLGARKIFLHEYPGLYYLLAVFERGPTDQR